jgi:GDPmannose 4,6-dehydratase
LEQAKWNIIKIEGIKSGKSVTEPLERDFSKLFGVEYEKTKVDKLMLEGNLEFNVEDEGILVHTDKGQILIEFDRERFRPADVPILMSDTGKIQKLGYKVQHTLQDIVNDQLNYFLDKKNRELTLI